MDHLVKRLHFSKWCRTLATVACVFVFLVAGGCGEKKKGARPGKSAPTPTPTAAAGAAQQPAQQEKPAMAASKFIPFLYFPEGKRDPFESLIIVKGKADSTVVDISQLPPLQQYDAAEYKLIGVVDLGEQGMTAMLVRPDGKGFSIREGTPVGLRGGRVSSIDMNGVTIEETVPDYRGNPTLQTVTLELRKEAQ